MSPPKNALLNVDALLTHSAQSRLARSKMLAEIARVNWAKCPTGSLGGWQEPLLQTTRLILNASAPMAVLIGREGILVCNDAVADMFGPQYAGSIGQPIFDILPHAADFYRSVIAAIHEGRTQSFRDQELKVDRGGALTIAWFDLNFSPIIDRNGDVLGTLVIAAETSERLLASKALQRSEERLSLALSASGMVGVWDLDLPTKRLIIDERFAQLFAIPRTLVREGIDHRYFSAAVHPEDREAVERKLDEAVRQKGEFRCEFRVTDMQGRCRWVLASGRLISRENGDFGRLPGVVVDITAQVEASRALAESELQFQTITESLPQIVWSTDNRGRYNYLSKRWYEFTGLEQNQNKHALSWSSIFHPDDHDRVVEAWAKARQSGLPYDIEYRFRHRSGTFRWMRVMASPLKDRAGKIVRWFGTATDIHETRLLAAERELVSRELDHRIKNIFSLFSALINLESRADPSMAEFGKRINGRILAINTAHNFLKPQLRSNNAAGSLKRLIALLLAPYGSSTIAISGDDIDVDERAATPLSLMFHELVTNAAKYGGLSTNGQGLRISLTCGKENILITWFEPGPKVRADEVGESGFGTKLLKLSVEGQLDGHFTYDWADDGLRVKINIPAQRLTPTITAH